MWPEEGVCWGPCQTEGGAGRVQDVEALGLMGEAGLEGCCGKHRSGPEQPGRMSSSGGKQREGAALWLRWASGRSGWVSSVAARWGRRPWAPLSPHVYHVLLGNGHQVRLTAVSKTAPPQQNSCLETVCFCTCVINLFPISEVWKVVFFLVCSKETEAWTDWVTDCWRSHDLSVGRTTVCVYIVFPSILTGTDCFWWLFHVCSFWWHKYVLVVKKKKKYRQVKKKKTEFWKLAFST